jgi:hypothetical protein
VWRGPALLKRLPLHGLGEAPLPFEWYVTQMEQEARIHALRQRWTRSAAA